MNAAQIKLAWYWNRLRSMSTPEMLHRLSEMAKRKASRSADVRLFDAGEGPLPGLATLRGRLVQPDEGLLQNWRDVLEAARHGRYVMLGTTWLGVAGPEKWHLDPVSGRAWAKDRYCFDISWRHERMLGDVKYTAELNRLQYLQPIAALAHATGDNAAARFCVAEIESWIDTNPPFLGIHWVSGIELALRVISFLVVIGCLGENAFNPAQKRKIRDTLLAHAFWLERYPSRYSSANNHLIAEATALFVLGTLAPDLPGATSWRDYGRETLIRESSRQFHEDGVGAEQSPTYTAFTLEMYLLCLHVAEAAGNPFPAKPRERLGRAGEFLRWITDSEGNQPRFGDDDEGRVITSQLAHERHYVSSVLACLAAMLNRSDLAPPQPEPHLRQVLFGVPAESARGPQGVRRFVAGGYTVARTRPAGRDAMLLFDHGPLGYLSIAAHGHADALAVWLHLDGQPIIADAGTYLYHSGGEWRDHFRGTRVHNTLCLGGADQSVMVGPFNWSQKARCKLLSCEERAENWRVLAEHDGYRRRFGLVHVRSVHGDETGYLIADRLEGTAKAEPLEASGRFIIAPNAAPEAGDGGRVRIHLGGRPQLELAFFTGREESGVPLPAHLETVSVSEQFGTRMDSHAVAWKLPAAEVRKSSVITRISVL